jgi:uncharacterized membrane protein YjgN (DUF898 family)
MVPELILPKMVKQKSIAIIAIVSATILAISTIGIIQNTAFAHQKQLFPFFHRWQYP